MKARVDLEILGKMSFLLAEDVARSMKELKSNNDQFNRRSFIRCYFSYVEANAFILRQMLVFIILNDDDEHKVSSLTFDDIYVLSLLLEETPQPAHNGALNFQQQKIPLLNHLAFTIKQCKEEFSMTENFLADNGWNEFQKSVKVRHRLTHPKSLDDISVSEDDLTAIVKAVNWFQNITFSIFKAAEKFSKDRGPVDL